MRHRNISLVFLIGLLLCFALVSCSRPSERVAPVYRITILNHTLLDICQVQFSRHNQEAWGDNLLQGTLPSGKCAAVEVPAGMLDFRFVPCNKDEFPLERYGVVVDSDMSLPLWVGYPSEGGVPVDYSEGDSVISPSPQPTVSAISPTPTPAPTPILLCPAASSTEGWQCEEDRSVHTRKCVPVTSSGPAWACYEDFQYGFAVEYPAEWTVGVSMNYGLHSDVQITRRHEFRGATGAVDIDIWYPANPDFAQWLKKHREVTGPGWVAIIEPNARVAGYPAAAFLMGDPQNPSPMLTVYVGNGKYVYRLWFTLHCDPEEIPIIRRMLDTFRFSAQAVPAEIPEEVWQEVQRAYEPPRCAPPPPTPGPPPTPRPVVLPSAQEVQSLTADWKVFEDPELGIRFRYPPEYEIRIQPMTGRKVGISIDRPVIDPQWGEGREAFDSILVFLLEKEDSRLRTPEGLEAWVRELPEDLNPIPGGGPIQVVEEIQVGGRPAFVIMEPLWPGDPPNTQSLIVVGRERVLWIMLANPMWLTPERIEEMWPLHMAFLATLEVTR